MVSKRFTVFVFFILTWFPEFNYTVCTHKKHVYKQCSFKISISNHGDTKLLAFNVNINKEINYNASVSDDQNAKADVRDKWNYFNKCACINIGDCVAHWVSAKRKNGVQYVLDQSYIVTCK